MFALRIFLFLVIIVSTINGAPFLFQLFDEYKNYREHRARSLALREPPPEKTWKDLCSVHYPDAGTVPGKAGVVCLK